MNVVISAPTGCGSLSDEIVLGGLLRHLAAHTLTVLSLDAQKTAAIHAVTALTVPSPGNLASVPDAWRAISEARLFIVVSAGVLNERGKIPARVWLNPLELAHRVNVKTAVVGAGALEIPDPRERMRVQRLLHNFTGCISARDNEAKATLASYGVNANRVSANGDPGLALAGQEPHRPASGAPRVGVVLSAGVPSRTTFGPEAKTASGEWFDATQAALATVMRETSCEVSVLCDDTPAGRDFGGRLVSSLPAGRVRLLAAEGPLGVLQRELAGCQAVFSQTLHGLILAAGCGTPVLGLADENGASALLAALGTPERALASKGKAFVPEEAARHLRELLAQPELSKQIQEKASALARKELQDGRMLEFLVPKRDRFPPRPPKPPRKGAARKRDSGAGFSGAPGGERFSRKPKGSPKSKGGRSGGERGEE